MEVDAGEDDEMVKMWMLVKMCMLVKMMKW